MPRKRTIPYQNSLITPIFQTGTYFFDKTADVVEYHNGRLKIGRYARYDNPTWLEVEARLARLDEADDALIFPSGMSAITTAMLALLSKKKTLIYTGKGYRNIRTLCADILTQLGIEIIPVSLFDLADFHQQLRKAAASPVDVVFFEIPSNPHLLLADIDFTRSLFGLDVAIIVDSTFATPVNFRPCLHGADLVVHSASKYLSGQADILIGSIAGRRNLVDRIRATRNVTGAICDPHCAFLLNRSLDTLSLRMQHLNARGLELATFLEKHPKVSRVFYTALPSHPQFELAKKYLSGHGGVVSFEVDASKEAASAFVDRLQVPYMGTNFGSTHSMVEQCSIFTYYKQSQQERTELGISDTLIRYSIGFEDMAAIIGDLDASLNLI
jgi:cystathionine gamma-synthase